MNTHYVLRERKTSAVLATSGGLTDDPLAYRIFRGTGPARQAARPKGKLEYQLTRLFMERQQLRWADARRLAEESPLAQELPDYELVPITLTPHFGAAEPL